MQAVLWIWPVMYKSIYGRFLLLQLGTTSNIVILNVLISVYNVAGRLATRQVHLLDSHGKAHGGCPPGAQTAMLECRTALSG